MRSATAATRDQVLQELRGGDAFLLVTHENPDGDALGSLIGMHGVLRALGKDVLMYMAPDELPLSYEYAWLPLDGLVCEPPDDLDDRCVIFLDCGNIDRNPATALRRDDLTILNLDHHHDNTRFGDIDHVVPEASSTAEIVWDVMRALDVEPSREVADALYVGLVTDTGRFMYENTSARAHEMAADLIAAGVDVQALYRRLYEGVPYAKLELLARALHAVERHDDGRLTIACVTRDDFDATGADDSHTEGIIDHLRAVAGTKVAALVREVADGARAGFSKVSLRSADGVVDVSAIARAQGGGGHRQAAGFTTDLAYADIVAFVRSAIGAQLAA